MARGRIVFADKTEIRGESVGCEGSAFGRLITYTSMTDYQSILCDPACRNQLVCLTYPLIGNVGAVDPAIEDEKIEAGGVVFRETISDVDHWLSKKSLSDWLKEQNKVALSGIDTREIIRHLRQSGPMNAVITTDDKKSSEELAELAAQWSPKQSSGEKRKQEFAARGKEKYHLAVLDLGLRLSLIDALTIRGCKLTAFTAPLLQEIATWQPDALIISSGSEQTARELDINLINEMKGRMPIFAVDAGFLLLARSFGLEPVKMKLGHSGANYPVRDLRDGRTRMTLQHHHFTVDRKQVEKNADCAITHVNINDNTVEGIRYGPQISSVQFLPDVDSMPHQTGYIWDQLLQEIGNG